MLWVSRGCHGFSEPRWVTPLDTGGFWRRSARKAEDITRRVGQSSVGTRARVLLPWLRTLLPKPLTRGEQKGTLGTRLSRVGLNKLDR